MKLPDEFDLQPRLWTDPPAGVPHAGQVFWKQMRDGARIRLGFWQVENPRGTVIVFPGRTEFIEKYGETVTDLLARGFSAFVIDWRGQGLSNRPLANSMKGHIDRFETYIDDFRELVPVIEGLLPAPYLLLCHSMGGNIGLRVLSEGVGTLSGAVFSAPMLGIRTAPLPLPAIRALAAGAAWLGLSGSYIFGGGDTSILDEAFSDNTVTHDVIRYGRNKKYVADEPSLALGPPTLGWLHAAFASNDLLAKRNVLESIFVPTLFVTAAEELLTDNAAVARAAAQLKGARLVELPGARHEILQEVDEVRARFWEEFDQFTNEHLGAG